MGNYRVLLADGDEKIRARISRKIDWASLGFALAGEAGSGREAAELAERLRPDVVLADMRLPLMDGPELCRRLRQTLPGARFVVFSGLNDLRYARQAAGAEVSEYVLKPISFPELTQALLRLREQLDRQRDLEALRRWREESLPPLRELFYIRLLSGQLPSDRVHDQAARYEIDLPGGLWTAALVHAEGPGAGEARNGPPPSLLSFLAGRFALEGGSLRATPFDGRAALLIRLSGEDLLPPLLAELERLSRLAQGCLGLRLAMGVGALCRGAEKLSRSAAGARSALDYRALGGGRRVLYIGDLESRAAAPIFEEEDRRMLSGAVRLETPQQAERAARGLAERLNRPGLSPSGCDLFLTEIVACLARLARSGHVDAEEVFGAKFTGAVSVSDFSSLEELSRWLSERCIRLRGLLVRKRSGSDWRIAERAKSYIAVYYTEKGLSVESLSSHIHLTPTYFSTVFKREVGMPFTAYVTKVRMEEAERLLRETDEKICRISEATGFSDPNYFSYVFKRYFGLSPSRFRAGLGG